MNRQPVIPTVHTLTIAEWKIADYFKFQNEAILKVLKWEVILWVCTEKMDVFARVEFEKLKADTKAYIIAELIKQKKEDKTYMPIKQKDKD